MDKVKNFFDNKGTYLIVSIFCSFYIELFLEMQSRFLGEAREGIITGEFSPFIVLKLILFAAGILIVLLLLNRYKAIFKHIEKYRFVIGLIIIAICTILELSGSSIGMYHLFLGYNYNSKSELLSEGTLLGIPRYVRTDEYATLTPMNFSQYFNNYAPSTEILRGTTTDVTTFYGNPSYALATLFRPFLWGYILFGSAKGLAFYWSSRAVALFLVSYEFGKLLTHRNKILSVTYAVLITFSQTIQWWYSTNGLMEMFIFGQLAVVLLYEFLRSKVLWQKVLCCLGIMLSAGGYLLTYYPAQQIPLLLVFALIGLFMLIFNRKFLSKKDVLLIIGTVVTTTTLIGVVLYSSIDTINITMNTAYPGNRVDTGGTLSIGQLFYYIIDIFTPIDDMGMIYPKHQLDNVCDTAVFYSLFPVGIISCVYSMIRRRRVDLLGLLLIIIEAFFVVYCIVGVPAIVAKITLLSYSTPKRIMSIIGIIDIILLFRFLGMRSNPSSNKNRISKYVIMSIIGVLLLGLGIFALYMIGYEPAIIIWVMAVLVIIWIVYLIIRNTNKHKMKLSITLICVILLTGLAVNPIQMGADVIVNDSLTNKIREIAISEPDAKWIVIGDKTQLNNIPIVAGAKTINSTNTYPSLDTWRKIDPKGANADVYNRYAHILMDVTDSKTAFIIKQMDLIEIDVNLEDLNKLGVSYILSERSLTEYDMRCIYSLNGFYIYYITD